MNYYIDESGTTGDLITRKFDLNFAKQPIFTHACIGLTEHENEELTILVNRLKKKYDIDEEEELKSQDLYFQNPEFMMEIISHIEFRKIPLMCEVMDKKYLIANNIVNHYILAETGDDEFTIKSVIKMKNIIADYLTHNLPQECYEGFYNLCKKPSEKLLLALFDMMLAHFQDDETSQSYFIHHMMSDRKSQYFEIKEKLGFEECIKLFHPIPDFDSNNKTLAMLPNVFSFYYMIARLNKAHSGNLSNVNLIHDTQVEFSETLRNCFKDLKNNNVNDYSYDDRADYNLITFPTLDFKDSKSTIGIQVADIIAGFLNRFINGFLYKEVKINEEYFWMMNYLISHNRNYQNSFGVNFVLPITKQHKLFNKFSL